MKAKVLLRRLKACSEAASWIGSRDLVTAWAECKRGDWMLWVCARMVGKRGWPSRQEVVLAACACAARTLKYSDDEFRRPHKAIAAARKWAENPSEVNRLAASAYAASAAAYAASAAASADASADASAHNSSMEKELLASARICRRMLYVPGVKR